MSCSSGTRTVSGGPGTAHLCRWAEVFRSTPRYLYMVPEEQLYMGMAFVNARTPNTSTRRSTSSQTPITFTPRICYYYPMISYLLFDLDNTLYSSSFGLEKAVGERMRQFTARFLGVSVEEAVRRRQERIGRYGTTLEWLMAEEGLTDVDAYYRAIHPEGEEENLYPDPRVRTFLEQLPLPKAILTNSPMEHAKRIIKKLEMEGLFTHIFDIRWNGLQGKPQPEVFYRVLKTLEKSPQEVLFIDDYPSYVKGYLEIGGRGILLDEENIHQDYPHPRIQTIFELQRYLEE